MNRIFDPVIVLAAALTAAAILAGCSASVTTFSADIGAPSANLQARDSCAAEVNARSTTREINTSSGARSYNERLRACVERYGVDPLD